MQIAQLVKAQRKPPAPGFFCVCVFGGGGGGVGLGVPLSCFRGWGVCGGMQTI